MKFKIGDKVKHKEFGFGKIVYINEELEELGENRYAVRFETFNKNLHDLGIWGAPEVKMGHGMWCKECDLELVEEGPQNLIPQIAKMLGVEIGEEFYLRKNFENDTNMRIYKFVEDGLKLDTGYGWKHSVLLNDLLVGKYTIQKLPKKPILTEDEKVILRNLSKYKWIARDNSGALYIYASKPKKDGDRWAGFGIDNFYLFKHLFQFIKWEDEEAYNIEELLKGE